MLDKLYFNNDSLYPPYKKPFDILAKGLSCPKKTPEAGLEPATGWLTATCSTD
jgi:hypothetical protein